MFKEKGLESDATKLFSCEHDSLYLDIHQSKYAPHNKRKAAAGEDG